MHRYDEDNTLVLTFIIIQEKDAETSRQYLELLKWDMSVQEGRADSLLNMPEAPFCASALASAAMELSPHCLPILAEFERTMAIAWIFGKDILKQASTPEQDMIQLKHQSKKRLHEWIVMGASELAPDHPLIDLLGRDYLKDYIKKVKASLPRHIALLPKTDQATLKKMEKELLHRLDQLNRQLQ